jgi:hypothetical protein
MAVADGRLMTWLEGSDRDAHHISVTPVEEERSRRCAVSGYFGAGAGKGGGCDGG